MIITMQNSFHGRTITTLAATGRDPFHQHFFPFTEGFRYVT
ncbi:aminotransferase class III-fold pyridoxal phosphate-dependent enzyme [bacterium D16-76]|nr:aminotransferase class III-fold pyridoxal phosphate-dependent enzyme [bacterium D16-76]